MKVIINGAGIAGPTLAWWLNRSGHEVTLVEQSPSLRRGGYIIDFWGTGYDIAERMGALPQILERGYQVKEVRFVNRHSHKVGGFSVDIFHRLTNNRFTSVRRSDISSVIFDSFGDNVETIFGDSVRAIDEQGDKVHVSFDHAPSRDADLVIGADGLHSRVRQIAFAPETDLEVPLGYHVAAFEIDGYTPRDELVFITYGLPGRQISRFAMREDKTLILCVFRNEYMPTQDGVSNADHKSTLRHIYSELGWECDRILEAMSEAPDVYFDSVSQIRMDHWTRGRTALAGDAAACVSLLAGEGTGLAMTEAYVLAAELARSTSIADAFTAYEKRMMPFVAAKQRSAAKFASSFTPTTALGVTFRNLVTRVLGIHAVAEWFIARDLRDDIELPDFP
jgi:2-polyprenyl-6-methoxyphenol hydroxylase-like FAD-dependent oxidoreductase